MKKTVSISLALAATMILSTASPASSRDRVVVRKSDDPAKVKVVEKKSPYIGIYMDDLNDKLIADLNYPESDGVWIVSVIEDSPAEKAGLEDDDIIYIFDGEKLENATDIGKLMKGKEAGDPVKMVIYRDGKKKELVVELGEHAKQFYTMDIRDDRTSGREMTMPSWTIADRNNREAMEFLSQMRSNRLYMGVRIHDMSPDLAGYFKVDKGVLVLEVVEDTPAAKAGIRGGDVITEAAGEKIVESEDLLDALGDVERGRRKDRDRRPEEGREDDLHLRSRRAGEPELRSVDLAQRRRFQALQAEYPRDQEDRDRGAEGEAPREGCRARKAQVGDRHPGEKAQETGKEHELRSIQPERGDGRRTPPSPRFFSPRRPARLIVGAPRPLLVKSFDSKVEVVYFKGCSFPACW